MLFLIIKIAHIVVYVQIKKCYFLMISNRFHNRLLQPYQPKLVLVQQTSLEL